MTQPGKPENTIKPTTWPKYILVGLLFFVLGFALCAGGNFALSRLSSKSSISTATLEQVEGILKQKFDGDIDPQKQSEGAAAGAVAALGDPYTVYLDEKANKELTDDLKGELSGVGIEVGEKNSKLTVIAPIDGAPASKAGIRTGDVIVGIDGADTRGMTIDEAVNKIRGQAGTQVKLTVIRGNDQPKDITLTREVISVPSVSSELKSNNVGYIKVRQFGEDTAQDLQKALTSLKAQGATSVVLDVRDNPGGYLQSAVEIASQFLPTGQKVVEERSRHQASKTDTALPGGVFENGKVVVLTNGGSASASEILAGALHDNGRATLVGDKTFGKGSVQEVICLAGLQLSSNCNGPSLKVTVAHWYTPNGINISKEGIKPDVAVSLSNDDYNAGRDPQLQKALEVATQP